MDGARDPRPGVQVLVLRGAASDVLSQQGAEEVAALAGMLLPTLMLSGFIFPISSMPPALQLVAPLS